MAAIDDDPALAMRVRAEPHLRAMIADGLGWEDCVVRLRRKRIVVSTSYVKRRVLQP